MADFAVTPAIRAAMAATWRARADRYRGLRPGGRGQRGVDYSPWTEQARKIEAGEYVECNVRNLPPATREAMRESGLVIREYDRVAILPDDTIAVLDESLIDKSGPAGVLFAAHGPGRRGKGRKKR